MTGADSDGATGPTGTDGGSGPDSGGANDGNQFASADDVVGGAPADAGEFFTEDYWFDEERPVMLPRGQAFLIALSGAGVYTVSFVFSAVGLQFVSPVAAQTYLDYVLNAVLFLPIPMVAYIAVGVGLEVADFQGEDGLPETTIPITLLVPVILHVSLFFVEWVDFGYTQATLADLFAQRPVLSQFVLWPPVVTGSIFAFIVYRATTSERDDAGSLLDFA